MVSRLEDCSGAEARVLLIGVGDKVLDDGQAGCTVGERKFVDRGSIDLGGVHGDCGVLNRYVDDALLDVCLSLIEGTDI